MKRIALFALPASALASLGACAGPAGTADHSMHARPVSSPTASAGSAQPQPPNSLPEGAAVNAPLTGGTGAIATTPVSPVVGGGGSARGRTR